MSFDHDHIIVTDHLGRILPPTDAPRELELEQALAAEHFQVWSSSFIWFSAGAMCGIGIASAILTVARLIASHV